MKVLVVEPFYTESHKTWLDGLLKYSSHEIITLTLDGYHWKWRMHGAAVTLAHEFLKMNLTPDLILCSDMLDVNVFIGLIRKSIPKIPIALYFHENQISYPWSPTDQDTRLGRDRHYGFINYTSALSADHIFFNSSYHKNSFITKLEPFLKAFPDHKNLESIKLIDDKSDLLYLGLDLRKLDPFLQKDRSDKVPTVLWNHRWEFDKNPDLFFTTLFRIKEEGIPFKVIVLGKEYPSKPEIFNEAKRILESEIIHWGYVESFEEYATLLNSADILPVTSNQDFFGISVVEAIYSGVKPLLPNRLAYPEHIVEEFFFYHTSEEFYSKLKLMLVDCASIPNIDLKNINSYDWSNQILQYDDAFSSLSANFALN